MASTEDMSTTSQPSRPRVDAERWRRAEGQEEANSNRYVGRRIGNYRMVRQVGRGGMARVFLAERADGQFAQCVARPWSRVVGR
jgi:hypothetical protein